MKAWLVASMPSLFRSAMAQLLWRDDTSLCAAASGRIARMAIELSGGCRVSLLREGAAKEQGTLRDWQHAGRENGAAAISLRVLELAPGRSPRLGGTACDEVLYVFEGEGKLHFEGGSWSIGPDTGVYVPPAPATALRGKHRRLRTAPARRLLSFGQPGRAVLRRLAECFGPRPDEARQIGLPRDSSLRNSPRAGASRDLAPPRRPGRAGRSL